MRPPPSGPYPIRPRLAMTDQRRGVFASRDHQRDLGQTFRRLEIRGFVFDRRQSQIQTNHAPTNQSLWRRALRILQPILHGRTRRSRPRSR